MYIILGPRRKHAVLGQRRSILLLCRAPVAHAHMSTFGIYHSHRSRENVWTPTERQTSTDKKQQFRHHFGQDCQKCDVTVQPEYDEQAIRRMAEWACKEHLIRMGLQERLPRFNEQDLLDGLVDDTSAGPHDQGRCGMCKQLGRACWK